MKSWDKSQDFRSSCSCFITNPGIFFSEEVSDCLKFVTAVCNLGTSDFQCISLWPFLSCLMSFYLVNLQTGCFLESVDIAFFFFLRRLIQWVIWEGAIKSFPPSNLHQLPSPNWCQKCNSLGSNKLPTPWLCNSRFYLEQRSPTFSAPGTGFVEDKFSTDGGRGEGDGSGGHVSDGEPWGSTWSFAHRLPLTSRCDALFLTGHRPIPVRSPGVGDPWFRVSSITVV